MTARPERTNLVIEAGAGTGKTTAIVREVLELLLDLPDISPERIVLMTFTEKAAGEIADRILEALADLESTFDSGEPRWPSDAASPILAIEPDRRDAARAACAKHIAQIDRLRSQTIHSFCQTLLRLYPIEAGLPPQFRVVEGFERGRLLHEIYGGWIETEIGADTPEERINEWRLLYRHYAGLDKLEETILSLVPRADLLGDTSLSIGVIGDVDADIRNMIDNMRALDHADVEAIRDDLKRDAAVLLRRNPPPENATIETWLEWFAPVDDLLPRIDLRPDKKTVNNALKRVRGDKPDASISVPSLLRKHQVAEIIRAVANRFFSFLDTQKELRGFVDFDDLLVRASRLLESPRVLAGVRARYDYLFVDEFQDTDRIQARIIDLLARDSEGAIVPGKTTIVGDPKQSIYAFRRADPETYRDTVRAFRQAGARYDYLGTQYRSDRELVEALNAIFAKLFPHRAPDPNVFRPEYSQLVAARPAAQDQDASGVRLLMASPDESRHRLDDEADAVAEWIDRNRDRSPGGLRRYAILLRKSAGIPIFADALERRGIRCIVPPAGSLLDQPAAVDLFAVLRAVAHPFDLAAKISAARSPYFALTDDEILHHRASCDGRDPACPWDAFEERLAAWGTVAQYGDVAGTIEMILGETAVESLFDLSREGDRARTHLDRLLEIAAAFDVDRGGSLAQFVDEIVARRDESAESEPNLSDESADAVRLMTVHASKGLEFDVVILPDLGFGTQSDAVAVFATESPRRLVISGNLRSISAWAHETDGAPPLADVKKERQENEEDRLFYVAVTRAKCGVVFVCHPAASDKGFLTRVLRIFGDATPADLSRRWPDAPGAESKNVLIGNATVPVTFERTAPTVPSGELRRFVSASATAIASRPMAGGLELAQCLRESLPVPETLERGEAARRLALSSGRVAGTLLHRLLERWDGRAETLDSLLSRLAEESGADAKAAGVVRRRATQLRSSDTWARFAAMATLGRELTFWTSNAEAGVSEARIDLLLCDDVGYIVVDYKGGRPSSARVARDAAQVRSYCAAVAAMSRRPCRGVLWYIDLERDDVVEVSVENPA